MSISLLDFDCIRADFGNNLRNFAFSARQMNELVSSRIMVDLQHIAYATFYPKYNQVLATLYNNDLTVFITCGTKDEAYHLADHIINLTKTTICNKTEYYDIDTKEWKTIGKV